MGNLLGDTFGGRSSDRGGLTYTAHGSAPFSAHGTSLGRMVASYFFAGIIGGAFIGLLRPISRWWWGAVLTGILVSFPILFTLLTSVGESGKVGVSDLLSGAVILGPAWGLLAWHGSKRGWW